MLYLLIDMTSVLTLGLNGARQADGSQLTGGHLATGETLRYLWRVREWSRVREIPRS